MSRCAWARPPVPMKPMPIRSLAPLASALRMVMPGTTAAAPAAPRKSRRVVPAPATPVFCLGVSRIDRSPREEKEAGNISAGSRGRGSLGAVF